MHDIKPLTLVLILEHIQEVLMAFGRRSGEGLEDGGK